MKRKPPALLCPCQPKRSDQVGVLRLFRLYCRKGYAPNQASARLEMEQKLSAYLMRCGILKRRDARRMAKHILKIVKAFNQIT